MKKAAVIGIITAAAVAGGTYTLMSLTHVGQGEVGVVYSMKGGIKEETLGPGFHFVGPLDKVRDFPISQQQLVLSNNPEDYGKKKHGDWHVDAPANGGMVKLNLTVNYNFLPEKVVGLYTKFNGMDGDRIVEAMVQNSIIAYIKEVTPQFSVMDIYSTKRSEVSKAITEYLDQKLTEEYGIHITSALIIDAQLDETLQKKIQAKEQAKQDAEKAELDKQTAKAQAEVEKVNAETAAAVAIEKAKGDAQVKRIAAEASAQKTEIDARAEAKANEMLSKSITPELIQMKEAQARLEHGWVTVQGADAIVK